MLRLLCFTLGLAICLLLVSFGQVPGLGRTGSGWFAPSSTAVLQFGTAVGGPRSTCSWLADGEEILLVCLLSLLLPFCFSHQLPVAACSNSRWPLSAALVLWAAHVYLSASFSPPSPLLAEAPSLLWLRINDVP